MIGVDLTAEPLVEYGCEGIFPNSTVTIRMTDNSLMPRLLFSLDVDDMTMANTQTTFGDLPAGDHTVYIYHENGCATSVDFSLDAYEPLTLTAIKSGPNQVTATAMGGFGDYEYFFQGDSYGAENVFLSNQDANVTVRVVDRMGCEATVSIPFKFTGMLEIPNFFTPNGDNMNDEWYPGNRDFFPNIEVKIYDRYGRVVAILDQVSGWDGNYDGKAVPSGDYWYEVNANDEDKQQFMGHFTLYR
jgi:gliding motility-associated-like protein